MLKAAAFGALAGAMMVFPGDAAEAAATALSLWARAVAPALGPFMVCMLMVSGTLGGGAVMRTAMGWLCGSPGGARLMREMGLRGRGALQAAAMTGTMGPMFFIGTAGGWLGNGRIGWVILSAISWGLWRLACVSGVLNRRTRRPPRLCPWERPCGKAPWPCSPWRCA